MKCSHKDKEEKSCKKRRNGSRKLHYGKQRIGEIRFFCFCGSMVSSNWCRRPEKEGTMSKYFTYAERITLQKLLGVGLTFKEIGRRLGKDGTTISREVRKHMSVVATGYPGYPYNPCKNRRSCRKKNLCGKENCHRRSVQYCKLCPDCGSIARTMWKRFAAIAFELRMSATAVKRLGNARSSRTFMMQNMHSINLMTRFLPLGQVSANRKRKSHD